MMPVARIKGRVMKCGCCCVRICVLRDSFADDCRRREIQLRRQARALFATVGTFLLPRFRRDGGSHALAGWFSCSIRLQREFRNGSHLGVIGGAISLTGFDLFPMSTASAICSGVIRCSSSSSFLRAFPCPWDAAKYSQLQRDRALRLFHLHTPPRG